MATTTQQPKAPMTMHATHPRLWRVVWVLAWAHATIRHPVQCATPVIAAVELRMRGVSFGHTLRVHRAMQALRGNVGFPRTIDTINVCKQIAGFYGIGIYGFGALMVYASELTEPKRGLDDVAVTQTLITYAGQIARPRPRKCDPRKLEPSPRKSETSKPRRAWWRLWSSPR